VHYLLDLTKAADDAIPQIVEKFLSAMAPTEHDDVHCILTAAQPTPATNWNVEFVRVPSTAAEDADVGAFMLQHMSQISNGGIVPIRVASLRPNVRHITETLSAIHGNIAFEYLTPYNPPGAAVGGTGGWDDTFVPRDDAVRALVRVLYRAGAPVRMTDLRKVLGATDSRFKKKDGTFNARPRFMSMLVGLAKERGFVQVKANPDSSVNPLVSLTSAGRAYAAPAPEPSNPGSLNEPQRVLVEQSAATEQASQSDLYITTLRRANLGPFQEVRLAVYEEMEKLIADGTRTPTELIRDAVSEVRESRAQELLRPGKPFPWPKVRTFISTLVSRVPVFLVNGEIVKHTWTEGSIAVNEFMPNWQLVLDGELVCFLLERGATISLDDIPALSGALYNSRSDEYFDRALQVIGQLSSNGRIANSPSDPLEIVLSTPS
jgi:hypothetical protein